MNIINTTTINTVNFIQDRPGQFRAIVKVQAGFMTIVDDLGVQQKWSSPQWKRAIDVFRSFRGGALQTIQFKADDTENWLTVFAKSGKKVKFMDIEMFEDFEVRDINDGKYWSTTNLYDQKQYAAVNSKTWASKVFVKNAA